jgi:hypothetical protein
MNNPLSGMDTSGLGGNCTTYSGVNSQGYWITIYCTYYSGVIVISVPVGGPTAGVGQSGGGGGSGGIGNLGLTKRQACYADALVNGALGFVPGYNATKTVASLVGFNFNPVQFANGDTGGLSGFQRARFIATRAVLPRAERPR